MEENYVVSVIFHNRGHSEIVATTIDKEDAEDVASRYASGYYGKTDAVKIFDVRIDIR